MATSKSAPDTPNGSFSLTRVPESWRLQQQTEDMIAKLELERRKHQQLSESVIAMKKAIKEKQRDKQQTFRWKKQEGYHKQHLNLLENKLQEQKIKLSQVRAYNKELRNEIEFMRKEKQSKLSFTGRISSQISIIKEEVQDLSKKANERESDDTDNRIKILTLGNTLEQERGVFSHHVSNLESQILEDSKLRSKFIKAGKEEALKQGYITEVSKLLNHLLEKWFKLIKEKRQALEQYKRYTNKLNHNIQVIKYHSGIDETSDLVRIIISTYDQNKEIESYIVRVQEQTSIIEEELNQCRLQISTISTNSSQKSGAQALAIQNRSDVLSRLIKSTEKKERQLFLIGQHCQQLSPVFSQIHKKLYELGFTFEMAELDEVNERQIKEQSVVIEEQLARFILFWNEWNARPNALTSLIDIDHLDEKNSKNDKFELKDILNPDQLADDNELGVLTVSQMRERADELLRNS